MGYMVIRDTREQDGWEFTPSQNCAGTMDATLKTGDYTNARVPIRFHGLGIYYGRYNILS
jgi:hypothetical protein